MVKKTALKIECGSFIHDFVHAHVVDLQLLLQIVSSIFGNFGHVIYRWKNLKNTFPTVYHTPKNCKNCKRKLQKTLTVRIVGLHKTVDKRTALNFECVFFTMFCYREIKISSMPWRIGQNIWKFESLFGMAFPIRIVHCSNLYHSSLYFIDCLLDMSLAIVSNYQIWTNVAILACFRH